MTHFRVDLNFRYIKIIYYRHPITVQMLILFLKSVDMLPVFNYFYSYYCFRFMVILLPPKIMPIFLDYYVLNSFLACSVLQLRRNQASRIGQDPLHTKIATACRSYNKIDMQVSALR